MVMEGEFFLFNLPYLLHDFYKVLFLVLACFFPSVFLLVALQFLVFSVCLWDFDGYRLFGEYVFSPFFWPVWAFFFWSQFEFGPGHLEFCCSILFSGGGLNFIGWALGWSNCLLIWFFFRSFFLLLFIVKSLLVFTKCIHKSLWGSDFLFNFRLD